MNQQPQVSIIVPIYNAEEYLERCVDSILGQEFRDFELLLIDDGSTDGSGGICDRYAREDERVRAVHAENSGVSRSRNRALDLARGTYIQFLDSDDWITPNATRLLVRSMEEQHCDMVIADFYRVSGERVAHKGDIEEDRLLTRQEFAAHMVDNPADFYYGVLWNKMYKREIIEKFHIRMDASISWCEDFLFNLEYIRHAHSFYALQVPIYYYVKRKGSLVTQEVTVGSTIRMKLNVFEYYNEFYKDVYDKEDYENIRLQVYSFFLASAKDGAVLPVPLPGVKKLGQEKNPIHKEAVSGDGIAMDAYRYRKLLECHLDTAAKKNNLSLYEALLVYYLHQPCELTSTRELADFANLSARRVSVLLQRLEKKKLVTVEALGKKRCRFTVRPEAEKLIKDLETAEGDFDAARFADFTEEEREQYERAARRIKQNSVRALENW